MTIVSIASGTRAARAARGVLRALAGAACAALVFPGGSTDTTIAATLQTTLAPADARPATHELIDETGRRVVVLVQPRRIVSLAPNLTETIYALGAEDRLVGVTDYCDFPAEAQAKSRVGGAINPNLEHIVALKPDLVLATRALNRRETVEALERLSIPTYATNPRSVEGVLESLRHVAAAIGAEEQGEALVAQLRARLDHLAQKIEGRPAKRVLFVVWQEPLISIGRETFLADALRHAGAASIVDAAQDWPKVNLEEVVRQQPDFVVFAGAHAESVEQTVQALRETRGWRMLEAVERRRIAVISEAVNRPAPRLVDAIEQLARQLHPEAFEQTPENAKEKPENWLQAEKLPSSPIFDFCFLAGGHRCGR